MKDPVIEIGELMGPDSSKDEKGPSPVEVQLEAVRKLMLAVKRDDEHGAHDALCQFVESYLDEDSDGDDDKGDDAKDY